MATPTHHPRADSQTEPMTRTIGQILRKNLLDEDQDHWPDYVAVAEMDINSTINARINKALFKVLYGENILLSIDLLLSREFSINSHAYTFAIKMKHLINKVKKAIHSA